MHGPTPRRPRQRPGTIAVALVCAMVAIMLLAALACAFAHRLPVEEERQAPKAATHDSLAPTYTHNGEIIRWYVLTDPDTHVQYLVNDRGGCTPRLDSRGEVMGVLDE